MTEGRHSGKRVHFFGILQITVNPIVASPVGRCGEIRSHSTAPAIVRVALAAAYLKEKLFTVIGS